MFSHASRKQSGLHTSHGLCVLLVPEAAPDEAVTYFPYIRPLCQEWNLPYLAVRHFFFKPVKSSFVAASVTVAVSIHQAACFSKPQVLTVS